MKKVGNKIKVPKTFMIGGKTIKVRFVKDLDWKDGNWGASVYRDQEILIQERTKEIRRTLEDIEETYLHELVHYILCEMAEEDMRTNEKFVTRFSNLLHQILKTSIYG